MIKEGIADPCKNPNKKKHVLDQPVHKVSLIKASPPQHKDLLVTGCVKSEKKKE